MQVAEVPDCFRIQALLPLIVGEVNTMFLEHLEVRLAVGKMEGMMQSSS